TNISWNKPCAGSCLQVSRFTGIGVFRPTTAGSPSDKSPQPTEPCGAFRFDMCLAIPGKLIEVAQDPNGVRMGRANFGGIVKQVCLEYTPEVQTGDYVLVHVGFALSKVNEQEAARTYQLLEEMKQLGELDTPDI